MSLKSIVEVVFSTVETLNKKNIVRIKSSIRIVFDFRSADAYLLSCKFHCRSWASPSIDLPRHRRSNVRRYYDVMVQCFQHTAHVHHNRSSLGFPSDRWPAIAFSWDLSFWLHAHKSSKWVVQLSRRIWQRQRYRQQYMQIQTDRDTVVQWTSQSIDTTAFLSSLWHTFRYYHNNCRTHRCKSFRCQWILAYICIRNRMFLAPRCSMRFDRNAFDLLWLFHMDLYIRSDLWHQWISYCDLADMQCMTFAVIPTGKNLSYIRRIYSAFHWDMYRAGKQAMSTLQLRQHPLLVLFGPTDMQHMSVECLVIDMSHADMVHNDHHRPIVVQMHIHRGIRHVMLLHPIVSFVPSHRASKRMNLLLADRNHDHMNGTNHFRCRGIYPADNVLFGEKKARKLDIGLFVSCLYLNLTFTIGGWTSTTASCHTNTSGYTWTSQALQLTSFRLIASLRAWCTRFVRLIKVCSNGTWHYVK